MRNPVDLLRGYMQYESAVKNHREEFPEWWNNQPDSQNDEESEGSKAYQAIFAKAVYSFEALPALLQLEQDGHLTRLRELYETTTAESDSKIEADREPDYSF